MHSLQNMWKGMLQFGDTKIGYVLNLAFNSLNAYWHTSVHSNLASFLRASPMVMDLHVHLHVFIRNADADPGKWLSGPFKLQIRMKNYVGTVVLPA